MAQPVVISATEQNTIGPNKTLVKSVLLKYNVGSQGPFTLVTTPADIASGAALAAMQKFANDLTALPGLQGA